MKANEIISDILASVNAQLHHRMTKCENQRALAIHLGDKEMQTICDAQVKILERIEKDLIQVEMNAKISYMGINTD